MSWLWNAVEKAESLYETVMTCRGNKYPSSIAWAESATIVYRTVLDDTLLDAKRTAGNGELRFEFEGRPITAAERLVLEPGEHELKAVVPETSTCFAAEARRRITVTRRPVTFTWKPKLSGVKRRDAFTPGRLETTAVDGLDGSPVLGTVVFGFKVKGSGAMEVALAGDTALDAGQYVLSAKFTPADQVHYVCEQDTCRHDLAVARVRPEVEFKGPPTIAFGGQLKTDAKDLDEDARQLLVSAAATHAGVSVAGRCEITEQPDTYHVTGGKVPAAVYTVKFIPTDDTQFIEVTGKLQIEVTKARPVVRWDPPADIVYGTLLSDLQLKLSCSPTPSPGKLKYSPGAQTKLEGGEHTLTATVTLSPDYETVPQQSVKLKVTPAPPIIEWTPAPTNPNTALGDAQLNAKASFRWVNSSKQTVIEQVPGSFAYAPAAGVNTNPAPGVQVLSVHFTPSNLRNFSPVDATAGLTLQWATDAQLAAVKLTPEMRDKVLSGKFKKDGSLVGAHGNSILVDGNHVCVHLGTNANGTRRYNVQKRKPDTTMSAVKFSTLPPATWDDDAFLYATVQASAAPGSAPDAKKRTTHGLAVAHPATGVVIPWEVVKNDRGEIIAAYPTA